MFVSGSAFHGTKGSLSFGAAFPLDRLTMGGKSRCGRPHVRD